MKRKGGLHRLEGKVAGRLFDCPIRKAEHGIHDIHAPLNEIMWHSFFLGFKGISTTGLRYGLYKESFNQNFRPFKKDK